MTYCFKTEPLVIKAVSSIINTKICKEKRVEISKLECYVSSVVTKATGIQRHLLLENPHWLDV